jgi:hypothetical protein
MQGGGIIHADELAAASTSRELVWAFVCLPLAVLIIGCAGFPAVNDGSPYKRLGGLEQIEAIVDEPVRHAVAVPGVDVMPESRTLPDLRRSVVARVCARSGGPCRASGAMQGPAKMTAAEFEVFVAGMRKVPEYEKLIRTLAARGDLLR